eukprot:6290006-Amphidinium_carterae.1
MICDHNRVPDVSGPTTKIWLRDRLPASVPTPKAMFGNAVVGKATLFWYSSNANGDLGSSFLRSMQSNSGFS